MTRIFKIQGAADEQVKFKKVRSKKKNLEREGQLNLFGGGMQVLNLFNGTPFEYALRLDENDDPEAAEAYLNAIKEGDCIADCYCNLGILESQTGNRKKAFHYLILAIKDDPAHPEAHFNLANLYFEEEDYKLAQLHFEIAYELNPSFTGIYFNLGLTYAFLNDYDKAIRYLNKFKSVQPELAGKADEVIYTLRRSQKE